MSESPSSSNRRLTRRSSSIVNRVETDRETIFFNSPDEQNADIVHEIVPEIRIAKQVFEQPGTVEKVRQVSKQIKTADEAVITRRKSLMPIPIETMDKKIAEVIDSPTRMQKDISSQEHQESQSEAIASSNTSIEVKTGLSYPPQTASQEIPQLETQSGDFETKDDLIIKTKSTQKEIALNISSVDTPTTIMSRNMIYKGDEVDDTSSDSSSSESDTYPVEGTLQDNQNATAGKWRWSDVFYCCWSRR